MQLAVSMPVADDPSDAKVTSFVNVQVVPLVVVEQLVLWAVQPFCSMF
jgi:hypothetical protein